MRTLRPVVAAVVAACALVVFASSASAGILIEIDKSAQRMTVTQDGAQLYNWPVSSGTRAHETPSGAYTPFRMEKDHYSREWDDAPMPNSIFFTQRGHAIHGTEHVRNIGRPASHGCVRLEPENARTLFALVKREGMANTRVVLSGATPGAVAAPAMARRIETAPAVVRRAPAFVAPDRDDDVTGSVPQRERVYQRAERPGYFWGGRPPDYDDRQRIYQPQPSGPFGRVFDSY